MAKSTLPRIWGILIVFVLALIALLVKTLTTSPPPASITEIETNIRFKLPPGTIIEGFHTEGFQDQLTYLRVKLKASDLPMLLSNAGYSKLDVGARSIKNRNPGCSDEAERSPWWKPDSLTSVSGAEIPLHPEPGSIQRPSPKGEGLREVGLEADRALPIQALRAP